MGPAKVIFIILAIYLLTAACLYPFFEAGAFFVAIAVWVMLAFEGGVQKLLIFVWTEGAKDAKPPEGPSGS